MNNYHNDLNTCPPSHGRRCHQNPQSWWIHVGRQQRRFDLHRFEGQIASRLHHLQYEYSNVLYIFLSNLLFTISPVFLLLGCAPPIMMISSFGRTTTAAWFHLFWLRRDWYDDWLSLYDLNVAYSFHSSCPLRQEMQEVPVLGRLPPQATSCRPLSTTEREWSTLPWEEKNNEATWYGMGLTTMGVSPEHLINEKDERLHWWKEGMVQLGNWAVGNVSMLVGARLYPPLMIPYPPLMISPEKEMSH